MLTTFKRLLQSIKNIYLIDHSTPEKLKDPSENNELTMTSKSIDLSFQDLIPVPVTKRTKEGTTRKRKVTHSSVLTDSPYKIS
jgi:hypothetical protein